MTSTEHSALCAELPVRGRLRPAMNQDTQFFWDAAAQGHLVAQQCTACGLLRHPPGPVCPACHGFDWTPQRLSGNGTLYSYTVIRNPPAPGFDGPAIVVAVDLDEGVRLVSNIGDVDPADLQIGERLEVCFLTQDEGWTAPQFRRPAPRAD